MKNINKKKINLHFVRIFFNSFMIQKKSKVCKRKFKKMIEERYYPTSFIERVNFLYHQNSMKKAVCQNGKKQSNIEIQ